MRDIRVPSIQRIIYLLEEIAFLLSRGVLEKERYLEALYASRFEGATKVHGNVRAQPATRTGEVSKPEGGSRVLPHLYKGITGTQKVKDKNDKITGGKKYYDGSI